MIKDVIISWLLSALSYDENHIVDYVMKILGLKSHFIGVDNGAHFFGLVYGKEGKAWLVNRGTDGYDNFGNMRSWLYDVNIFTGDDGVANGFQRLGDFAFNRFKTDLYNFSELDIVGHSQGAIVSPYEACLCAENLPNIKHTHFDIFAYAPTGNQIFADRSNKLIADNKISGNGYMNSGDPIGSSIFRNPKSNLLNGVDVGNKIMLPKLIGYNLGPFNVVNHSCRLYNAALLTKFAEESICSISDFCMLGEIAKRIVN